MTTMSIIANFFVGIVGILHVYFLILEMFLWDKQAGLKAFENDTEAGRTFAADPKSKSLAANLGLYNGFVAAGLFWSLIPSAPGTSIKLFFLSFVVVAGVFGGLRRRKILLYQALPGAVALALVWLS
jgi:putative membrane protein